jgi:hypothetical protein
MNKSIFLDVNGLTTTSAQHIKDMAGHLVDNAKNMLASISFVNEEMSIIGNTDKSSVCKGLTPSGLPQIDKLLKEVCNAQSLQAWLGEAIRAKEECVEYAQTYSFDQYLADEKVELVRPKRPTRMTEKEWLNSLNIKERNEYLHLQTICAVYGKLIHPNGSLDNARKAAYEVQKHPMRYTENGSNTIFHYYSTSCTIDEIEQLFFELQNTHRENQARFNGLKHKFELLADELFEKANEEYGKAMDEYEKFRRELEDDFYRKRDNMCINARALKIIIPNDLQAIYDRVSKLGK